MTRFLLWMSLALGVFGYGVGVPVINGCHGKSGQAARARSIELAKSALSKVTQGAGRSQCGQRSERGASLEGVIAGPTRPS